MTSDRVVFCGSCLNTSDVEDAYEWADKTLDAVQRERLFAFSNRPEGLTMLEDRCSHGYVYRSTFVPDVWQAFKDAGYDGDGQW